MAATPIVTRQSGQAADPGGSRQVTLYLSQPAGDSSVADRLEAVAGKAAQMSPQLISVRQDGEAPFPGRASLTVAHGTHKNIRYLAVPEGVEEAPFFELIQTLTGDGQGLTGGWIDSIQRLAEPAELLVFIAPGCPSCPHLVRIANSIAVASPMVVVTVVDASLHQDLAAPFNIRSVPTVVIDGELSLTGVTPVTELADLLVSRGSRSYQDRLFASRLESGRFTEVAASLCRGDTVRLFTDQWRASTLETRIRLMLAAEEALAINPSALDPAVSELTLALASEDQALRGDTADLLGRIGHRSSRVALEAMLDDPDPEIVEAATDALAAATSVLRHNWR
jgi:thioredoxin-like negative regulator of GroEL